VGGGVGARRAGPLLSFRGEGGVACSLSANHLRLWVPIKRSVLPPYGAGEWFGKESPFGYAG